MGLLNCICLCNQDYEIFIDKYAKGSTDVNSYIVYIQKCFRGFLFRREFLRQLQAAKYNIIEGVKFEEQWDFTRYIISNKIPQGFDMTFDNLAQLRQLISKFYKSFLTIDLETSSSNQNPNVFQVKEALYSFDLDEQFLFNFKILIFNTLTENFDFGNKDTILDGLIIEYSYEADKSAFEKIEASSICSASFKKFTYTSDAAFNGLLGCGKISSEKNSIIAGKNIKEMNRCNSPEVERGNTHLGFVKKVPSPLFKKEESSKLDSRMNNVSEQILPKRVIRNESPPRSVKLFQKILAKNEKGDFTRSITRGSRFSKKSYPAHAHGTDLVNDNSLPLGIDYKTINTETLPLISLFGKNDIPTFENILDTCNKLLDINLTNSPESIQKTWITLLDKTEGEFYNGILYGKRRTKYGIGVQLLIDRAKGMRYKYFGYFKNDKFHGIGLLIREDNFFYKGEFRKGLPSGYGIEVSDNLTYKGFFHCGRYHGYGEAFHKNKKIYRGCFHQGNKEGIGYQINEDGSKYVGNFSNGKMNLIGKFFWKVGHTYYGEWKDDQMHGKGKYQWKSGDIYIGGYEHDLRHGDGEYLFAENNSILKGTWNKGKKNGRFALLRNGECIQVCYAQDQQVLQSSFIGK